MATETIPPGHMRNAQGHLVPISLVKPIDQERDRLVRELAALAEDMSTKLAQLKAKMFSDVAAFIELSAEEYGVKRGGKKGNVTLHTFDHSYRLQIAKAESITFDERLQAAKALIDECASEWAESSDRAELKVVVQQVFRTDKEGNLSVGRILGLRRWEITDPRWKEAMRAIGESIQVIGSREYIRFHKRVGTTERYAPIPLDVVDV